MSVCRVLLTLGVTASLGALLLAACGAAQEPAQTAADKMPEAQQQAFRPRDVASTTTTAATVTMDDTTKVASESGASAFIQVAAGENHSCALQRNGRVQCWGLNDDGQLDVPQSVGFQQITAGSKFACGIRSDDGITCWGQNDHNQLDVPDGHFSVIDACWDHACALAGGLATCWGWNANERAAPPTDVSFTAIGAGAEHSCGLTANADLLCWGKNDDVRAKSRSGPFSALAVGVAHTCVLTLDGTAVCQGENSAGQSDTPEAVFEQIKAGSAHTCGLLAGGSVECWGADVGEAINVRLATPEGPFESIATGWHSTCGLNSSGSAQCWSYVYEVLPVPPFDRLSFTTAFSGHIFSQPTDLFEWPERGIAIVDREGLVVIHSNESAPATVLDMTDIVDSDGTLNGLLSAALDPDFDEFPYLYIGYTYRPDSVGPEDSSARVRLARLPIVNERAKRDDELVILDLDLPEPGDDEHGHGHYGGVIRFSKDGILFLGIGDADCFECPQRLDSLFGKIIRIDVRNASAERPYGIPRDYPFHGDQDIESEIWAYGLRNPWRMAFDPDDGRLWVGDVGHDSEEEISIASSVANLGWPILEGHSCVVVSDALIDYYRVETGFECNEIGNLRAPTASYGHRRDVCAVVGGVVHRGRSIGWLNGVYVFGDYCSGRVWALGQGSDGETSMIQIADLDWPLSSFGTNESGEVYLLTIGGPVLRLVEGEEQTDARGMLVPSATITPAGPRQA